jgi:hypothetical protein
MVSVVTGYRIPLLSLDVRHIRVTLASPGIEG